ncbi:MAG: ABC transporter permease [Leptospiraceae bacterium]|nr:ABC transporter permease [Leptospiraceae bacterium]
MKFLQSLVKEYVFGAGYTLVLLFNTIIQSHAFFFKRNEIVTQMFTAGIKSLTVVSIVAVFTGMIMGLNAGLGLKDFGAEGQIGLLLTITLTREMSPFMTALILSASVGSAIAAEIGTMKVSEEIDALEVMSIDPVRYLVMPRVIGFSLMVPILCVYSTILGVLGGSVVGHFQLGVDYQIYFRDVIERVSSTGGLKDLYVGLLKGLLFGVIVSIISCSHGLRASNGAIGVGKATRESVVTSFLVVIFFGYVVTAIFFR